MTSKLTRERLEHYASLPSQPFGKGSGVFMYEVRQMARALLAAIDSEPVRNPVLAYADSYRDMAKQGVESVPIWSVITDLERNIAPLYRHAQQPVVPDDIKLRELFDSWFASDCSFDRSPEASEEDNIAWRESYWYVWQRCRAAMLQAGNSPVIPDGSASMLRRWLVFGRGMQNAGSQLPHNLIAETEEMLAAADCSIPMISDRWVPVSEKLPERGDYLVSDGRDFDVQLFNGEQFIPGFVWEDKITHWMPLPATPQEVK